MRNAHPLSKWLPLVLAMGLLIVGVFLHPVPLEMDLPIPGSAIWGSFFIFGFWLFGTYSWGECLAFAGGCRGEGAGVRLALGSAGAALTAGALGHLGLIDYTFQPLLIVLLLLGVVARGMLPESGEAARRPFLAVRLALRALSPRRIVSVGLPSLIGGTIILAVLYRIGMATVLAFHSDPLYDHLVGPRIWTDAGRIFLPPKTPFTFKCAYWEYLFIWGNVLLGGFGGKGLLEGQVFAQWTHAVLGFGGSALLMDRFYARFLRRRAWRYLAIYSSLTCWFLYWTTYHAKNDWGTCLWTFCGLHLLLNGPGRSGRARWASRIAAGAMLGMAISGKFVTLLTIAPFGAVWAWLEFRARGGRELAKDVAVLTASAAAALAPLLARNWLLTGNPVYPVFNHIFHSPWLSWDYGLMMGVYEGKIDVLRGELFVDRLALLAKKDTLDLLLVPGIILIAWKGRLQGARLYYLAPLAALALLLATLGPPVGADEGSLLIRLLGPGLILALGFAVVVIHDALESLGTARAGAGRSGRFKGTTLATCTICVLYAWTATRPNLEYAWYSFSSHVVNSFRAARFVPMGAETKAWLRLNARPEDLILTSGDSQIYYVSHLNVSVILSQPYLSERLWFIRDSREIARILLTLNTKYYLDTAHWDGRYWSVLAGVMDKLVDQHPEAVLFESRDSYVVDLPRLAAEAAQACLKPAAPEGVSDVIFRPVREIAAGSG